MYTDDVLKRDNSAFGFDINPLGHTPNDKTKKIIAIVVIGGICFFFFIYPKQSSFHFQGYVEGEPIYLASPYPGLLKQLYVVRGQQVQKGLRLFQLDSNPQSLQLKETQSKYIQAKKSYKI